MSHPPADTTPESAAERGAVDPTLDTGGGGGATGGTGRSRWYTRRPAPGSAHLALKNHFIACVGEFVGTATFLFFALGGTNVANIPNTSLTGQSGSVAAPNTSNLLYISLAFGFSLAITVSGGLFNPAVSLAMALVGAVTPLRAALLTASQLVGAIVGAALISGLTPGPLHALTTLSPGMSISRGCFLEMFATFLLVLAVLFLAAEKTKATVFAPIGIGLALFVAELATVFYTGGSLNPARSFAPAVVMGSFPGYHWVYWVGPALGAMLAAAFYRFLKWMEFETVMGGGAAVDTSAEQLPAPKGQSLYDEEEERKRREKREGKERDVQGPGIPDLLTGSPGEAAATYELPPTVQTQGKLDRIEHLLAQLLPSSQAAPGTASTSGSGSAGYKPSMEGTLYEADAGEGGMKRM
ncbi:hypothetical protein JCM10213_005050 [Rhodosporidiobolus nylandii]